MRMRPTSDVQRLDLRFYAELNDLLPPERRRGFTHLVEGRPAVKDVIESLGVPHTEVDVILADGESVDFSWRVRDGARVSVYPVFEAFDVTPLLRLRPKPLREPRFVLDVHLGRLARDLRLLGFDAQWPEERGDEALAEASRERHRILLTCDRGLLKRSAVTHGYCVRSRNPAEQAPEVLRRFDLLGAANPFTRCLRCNGVLEPVAKEDVITELPRFVAEFQHEFRRCRECRQLFWPGTHHQRLVHRVEELLARARVG